MVKTILLLLLIASIHSTLLKVTQINDFKEHEIRDQSDGLVCVELSKELDKDQKFYFLIQTKEKGKTIDKNIYYNITGTSCQNYEPKDVNNLTEFSKQFEKINDDPDKGDVKEGFSYQYTFEKKDDNQKFVFLLFKDFTGKVFTISYWPVSAITVLVTILIIIGVIIIIIIVTIVICCCCCCKKKAQIQGQFQSSYAAEPIMPQENIIH